jgi:hypothetical protein
MSGHAKLSPSSAARWMTCPGSVTLSEGIEDTSSSNANEGTMMHAFAAKCLETGTDAAGYVGQTDKETGLVLQAKQAKDVQFYVDHVRDIVVATNGELHIEQRLPIGWLTGEDGAHGTADAVIVTPDELIIVDAKFGFKLVDADSNPQLMIYAAAAWDELKVAYDFQRVRIAISQPRLLAKPEFTFSMDDMQKFIIEVAFSANLTRLFPDQLVPSSKACQWCRAKPVCPALHQQVMDAFDESTPLADVRDDKLAYVMDRADMIEGWIKSIRAEVERRLLAGEPVTGYKLVQGKRGNRMWASPDDAEAALKAMRVKHDQMYDYKLASPTSIEKLVKADEIGPRQWTKIQALITQSEGQPSVAPKSDKRPALVTSAAASDFDDVTTL